MAVSVRDREAQDQEADYLRRVGERVREARARRGMTRKRLARDSGVSERYIAQLEAGQGNISILLLRQLTQAMNLSPEDMTRDAPDRPVEMSLLIESLTRLTPAQLAEARHVLGERFGGAAARNRVNRVALIGLRGAGKSTLGALLARARDVSFVELDREIERLAGATVGQIFDLYGQGAYRRYERRALETVLEQHDRAIIAAGGSIVAEPGTYDLLLTSCYTIWLTASPEEHMSRVVAQSDLRPMAGNDEAMADLRNILAGRAALYAKADATIDTAGMSVTASLRRLQAVAKAAR
jgi:XRE family aerobic/anaerobic benzoate catabolism transcriptional regulator